jgi:hypothetical protein
VPGDLIYHYFWKAWFVWNGSAWEQLTHGHGSTKPATGTVPTDMTFWDSDTKSLDYHTGSNAWKSSPFNVLLDDEIHFWDLNTDPGDIAGHGRANVAVSATGCTTTMIFFGWITSTLGLEISGTGTEASTDFAQHFCSSNGTLTHVFYNRDSGSSNRRAANSCTMGVDWS